MREEDRQLIERLYASLRRFATVVHPPGVDPSDLVQDVLVRVLDRGGLTDINDPELYLRRAIVNQAVTHHRRLGRHARALITLGRAPAGSDDYPSDLADLMRLPPRSRAVLYLSAVEGLSFAEIADVVGCTEGSARMAASRARRRLAAALARGL